MKYIDIALLALCALVFCGPAVAQEPPPFPEFTFRTVKPPVDGATNLIDVQVEPGDELPPPEEPVFSDEELPATTAGLQQWFWDGVSPELTAAGPGRFEAAVNQMAQAPVDSTIAAARLQDLRVVAASHGTRILMETIGKKISPAFILAIIGVESSGISDATSVKGARGLMQLMPATAARFGVEDSTDPEQNIRGGVAYLVWLLNKFEGDPILALAGYNAGENAVIEHDGVPLYPETRTYIPKIVANWQVARALCVTPPELFTDGCVFSVESNP